MSNINIITPPDKLYNDAVNILLVFPSKDLQHQIQTEVLTVTEEPLNVYLFDKQSYSLTDTDWLLTVFNMANIVLIDVDQCPPYVKDLLSYMIAKPKTYWLTNAVDIVYNHISNNRINNISFLSTALGGNEKEHETQ